MGKSTFLLILFFPASLFACTSAQKATLTKDTQTGCVLVRRALTAIEKHPGGVKALYPKGANMGVYYRNPRFYHARLKRRVQACDKGDIHFKCVGKCGTDRETLAYVRVTFGFVHGTINVCNEYFQDRAPARAHTLIHEYGRLEGIGDSPDFDTNNIFVWDTILELLSGDYAFKKITETP